MKEMIRITDSTGYLVGLAVFDADTGTGEAVMATGRVIDGPIPELCEWFKDHEYTFEAVKMDD